jgi:uncharacterized protein (TIGR02996 family)
MSATKTVVTYRFENRRSSDVFFRELTVDGLVLRIYAAVTDAAGTTTRVFEKRGERFKDEAAAKAGLERLLSEARRNFKAEQRLERQVSARPEGLAPAASNPALEAAVRANRADGGAARVYADWLSSQGDVRGELAALLQADKQAEAKQWLADNADRVLGEHDVRLDDLVHGLEWTNGFLDQVSLRGSRYGTPGIDLAGLTASVLRLPVAAFLRRLRFGLASYASDNDWSTTMEAVTSSPLAAQLTTLLFNDYTVEDCEISWTAFGDFSGAWERLPALEHLHIRSGAGGTLGDLVLPGLKRFVRESGGLAQAELDSIFAARWPALEHLEVWTGSDEYGAQATVDSLRPLFEGANTPALRSLGLVNCQLVHECLEPLARSKVLPRLERLDLSKGALMDRDVDLLLKHALAFRHLAVLDLRENLLEQGGARIAEVLPNALVGDQRELYDDGGDDRYTAVGE